MQLNNGLQSGAETIAIGNQSLADANAYLSAKAASHTAGGWTVTWAGLTAFTAVKSYPNGMTKSRTFTLSL